MSRWLALALDAQKKTKTPADNRLKAARSPVRSATGPFLPVSAGCRLGARNKITALADRSNSETIANIAPEKTPDTDAVKAIVKSTKEGARVASPETLSSGASIADIPLTWAGSLVSLDAWCRSNKWENCQTCIETRFGGCAGNNQIRQPRVIDR